MGSLSKKELQKFYEILKSRYSVRNYLDHPIPEEKIERIMETAQCAASAANRQPWSFIICKGKDKEGLNDVFYREGFKNAPVAIAAIAHPDKAWVRREDERNYSCVDVTIAVTELILAATAEGIGSCWVASFNLGLARKILNVQKEDEIVSLITLGFPHPDEKCKEKDRKPIGEIVYIGKYK